MDLFFGLFLSHLENMSCFHQMLGDDGVRSKEVSVWEEFFLGK